MKIQFPDVATTKLCHARPGDVVQLGATSPHIYLVCVTPDCRREVKTPGNSGLWVEDRPLHLTNLSTGETLTMPHLSTRVIKHKAILVLGEDAE